MISSKEIREIIIDQSKRANVGHIGSALSISDIIAALYGKILNVQSSDDPERDRFILSKGHAALALYAAFFLKGWITQENLNTYCADNSLLSVHPEASLNGVEFATGSLGQGLSIGVGCALAAKTQCKKYRTFVLVSDAECNEGSVWEAIMFAGHHKLSNLVLIVDDNSQQAFGYTKEVMDIHPIDKKLGSFGWKVLNVDGHNIDEIEKSLSASSGDLEAPVAIIAKTTFGKGVSYMENKIKWHYWPMSDEEYKIAKEEIGSQE